MLHDIVAQQTKEYGCEKLFNIPPEQVLVAHDWPNVDFEDCPFLEIIDYPTISALRQNGYEVEDDISDDSSDINEMDTRIRRSVEGDDLFEPGDDGGSDPSMRRVKCRYAWMMIDVDEDGIAELRKFVIVGSTILNGDEGEETDLIPVAAITPIRQPHEHYGLSLDDVVQDLQRIRTVLVRGFLDNMYVTNNSRHAVNANLVNLDDLLVTRPNGVVRVNGDPNQAIAPIITQPNGPAILSAVEYIDSIRESRTGVTRYNQGLDANSLNKTATGITQIMTAAQQRIEMIARIFAETGVKSLMLIVHAMAIRNGSSQEKMKLRNKWVPVNPQEWKTRKNLTVAVGLGTGNKDQMLQHLMMILTAQKEALPLGLTGPKEIYNALARLTQNAGFKQTEEFWKDPGDNAQLPAPPNPEAIKAQAEAQKTQAQLQADQQKTQAQLQADAQKFQAQAAIDQERMAFEASEKEKDRQLQLQIVREQEATKLAIENAKLEHQSNTMAQSQSFEAEKLGATFAREDAKEAQVQEKTQEKDDGMSELLKGVQDALGMLAKEMGRPKKLIRGPDGKAIGVQ